MPGFGAMPPEKLDSLGIHCPVSMPVVYYKTETATLTILTFNKIHYKEICLSCSDDEQSFFLPANESGIAYLEAALSTMKTLMAST